MAKFPQYFLDELRNRIPVSEIVARRVTLKRAGREWKGLSPFNKEKTPSFFVNDQKQAWFDFSSGLNGTIFDFLMRVDGLTFPEAVEELARIANMPLPEEVSVRHRTDEEKRAFEEEDARRRAAAEQARQERDREDAQSEAERIEAAAGIMRAVVPIAGTHAEAYLNDRGLPTPEEGWPDVLGFAKSLKHPCGRSFPALVARIDDREGDFTAIWRIFLDHKKPAKAALNGEEKLGLGASAGGAVRIGGTAPHTDVGEGIESSLGAWMMICRRRPVWATLSTSGMAGFDPPDGMQRCDIFPDGDFPKRKAVPEGEQDTGELDKDPTPAGRRAARALRARLNELGVKGVINPEPPAGQDYLDVWNSEKEFILRS